MGIDRDDDTLLNGVETDTGIFMDGNDTGTSPANPDTDGDGFDDGVEVLAGTDPNNPAEFPGSGPPVAVPSISGIGLALLCGVVLMVGRLGLRRRTA
jgi:hypothetical protein